MGREVIFVRKTPQPLTLLPRQLPSIPRVTDFSCDSLSNKLNPDAIALILHSLPNLDTLGLDLKIEDPYVHAPSERAHLYSGTIPSYPAFRTPD